MTAIALPLRPWILLEEESEETEDWLYEDSQDEGATEDDQPQSATGGPGQRSPRRSSGVGKLIEKLLEEREAIIGNDSLSPRDKIKLLESNRKAIVMVRGGHIVGTEKVVYSLIGMSTVVTIVLACLTTFSDLPQEVTLTFTGTVVGGLIATVAQKIGRL